MHPDRDFVVPAELGEPGKTTARDLGLDAVVDAMGAGDSFLRDVARAALLAGAPDPATIVYRQRVLDDCRQRPALVRELYAVAVEALEEERQVWEFSSRSAATVLHRSLQVLRAFLDALRRLRKLIDSRAGEVRSEGWSRLIATMRRELDEAFFAAAEAHLERLSSREGILLSAEIGPGGKGAAFTLRAPATDRESWLRRMIRSRRGTHTILVADRDESGHRIVGELIDRGLTPSAIALGRSVDHMLRFFRAMRTELGFYVGALNLHDRLAAVGVPVSTPRIQGEPRAWSARALYDVGLALRLGRPPVPNDLDAADRRLVLITGANQGGKSTFLRAVGLAQLMAQCGLCVGASEYSGPAFAAILTHFKREEEATADRGKLDEELARLSALLEHARPGALLLLNESFASTNEREGSEIARQTVRALLESDVTVVFVTFLFDFASGWFRAGGRDALFLRAERLPDGRRSFRLLEGAPLPTSFGVDLYREIFESAAAGRPPVPAPG